ncbi:unnamed protein product [Closterium sp. Naga37s-1]|nr:unnamed protein product [Closterium sp. Naga37s-1]
MLSRLISHSFPFPIPSPRLSPHSRQPANFTSDIFNRQLPDAITTALKQPWKKQVSRTDWSADVDECRVSRIHQPIPVVVVHQQPSGSVACRPSHFMARHRNHLTACSFPPRPRSLSCRPRPAHSSGGGSSAAVRLGRLLPLPLHAPQPAPHAAPHKLSSPSFLSSCLCPTRPSPPSQPIPVVVVHQQPSGSWWWCISSRQAQWPAAPPTTCLATCPVPQAAAHMPSLSPASPLRVSLCFPHQPIPVVVVHQQPSGSVACRPSHFMHRNLRHTRQRNAVVYFIGPDSDECVEMARELDIVLDPVIGYQDVVGWFSANLGDPVSYQVRWFILKAFMERHAFPRIFFLDSDVILFANITELATMLFSRVHLVVSQRWPSLRAPGPSQYASTAVSGHVSLWTYDALSDFLDFFQLFVQEATLYGQPGDARLVAERAYNDMVVLGWYTHRICWMKNPQNLHPQCICDKESGVTPERSARIRGKFTPKFRVDSFATPRWCNATDWWDEGWCVFDNNFSIQTPTQFFKYRPQDGMKCPSSMHYTHFDDWAKEGEKQTSPVQFLGVHLQAHRKGYLTRGDDPAATWGSSPD